MSKIEIAQNKCFICEAPLQDTENTKAYFCEKHNDKLIPLCETCALDFDEENCKFCELENAGKPQSQQEESKKGELKEEQIKKYSEGVIRAACILPDEIYVIGEKAALRLQQLPHDNMKILTYSSFELIGGDKDQDIVLQTGGIENFMDTIHSSIILPSNICWKLIINASNQNYQIEEFNFALKKKRYCHASKKIREGEIAIIGGQVGPKNYLDSCELIDLNKKTVKEIGKLNKERAQCSVCLINNYLYAFGGFNGIQSQECSIERISVDKLENWEIINLVNSEQFTQFTGCCLLNCLKDSDEVFILGGSDGKQSSENISKFNAKSNQINEVMKMNNSRCNGAAIQHLEDIFIVGINEEKQIALEKCDLQSKLSSNIDFCNDEFTMEMILKLFLSQNNFIRLN